MPEFQKIDFPIYLIISSVDDIEKTNLFVKMPSKPDQDKRVGTYPHFFDVELLQTLKPIALALHFPRTIADFSSISGLQLKNMQSLSLGQRILHYPTEIISENFCKPLQTHQVRLIFYEDSLSIEKIKLLKKYFPKGQLKPFKKMEELSLSEIWEDISTCYGNLENNDDLKDFPFFSPSDKYFGVKLPSFFLAKQMGITHEIDWNNFGLFDAFELQARLEAACKTEKLQLAPSKCNSFINESRISFKYPLVLVAPGVAFKYSKAQGLTLEQVSPENMSPNVKLEDMRPPEQEMVCAKIIACHEALTQNGISISTDTIPKIAFEKLDQLETHLLNANIPKGRFVWRVLKELDQILSPIFDEKVEMAIGHADRITAYTRFPIGLKFNLDATSPLSMRTPIVYRSILPLTRTFQLQFTTFKLAEFFSQSCKVLMADLTSHGDNAGKIAQIGANFIEQSFRDAPNISIENQKFTSLQKLDIHLKKHMPDVLIITAHGYYDRKSNTSGIICGNEKSIGEEIKNPPKFIFLRSCNVIPLGISSVSIVDILMRNGAYSVIGSSVPIYAQKSNHILVRLLNYISQESDQLGKNATLLDAWFQVLGTNPVLDIITANDRIYREAMTTEINGKPLIKAFMDESNTRANIHADHVYKESENLLLDLTKGLPIHKKLKRIIVKRDYVPETIFYQIFGWPERIFLNRSFPNTLDEN